MLTPHDGEYARSVGAPPGADRIAAARALAARAQRRRAPEGPDHGRRRRRPVTSCVVTEGDARLATAGTGDVLSGDHRRAAGPGCRAAAGGGGRGVGPRRGGQAGPRLRVWSPATSSSCSADGPGRVVTPERWAWVEVDLDAIRANVRWLRAGGGAVRGLGGREGQRLRPRRSAGRTGRARRRRRRPGRGTRGRGRRAAGRRHRAAPTSSCWPSRRPLDAPRRRPQPPADRVLTGRHRCRRAKRPPRPAASRWPSTSRSTPACAASGRARTTRSRWRGGSSTSRRSAWPRWPRTWRLPTSQTTPRRRPSWTCFDAVLRALAAAGIEVPAVHVANSAGAIAHPAARSDVRACRHRRSTASRPPQPWLAPLVACGRR